jgi:hypothetical protein
MNERPTPAGGGSGGRPEPEDWLETLLRSTAPRPSLPDEATLRVRTAVHARWRAGLARPRRRLLAWGGAAAAVAAAASIIVIVQSSRSQPPVPVAPVSAGRVERVTAPAWSRPAGPDGSPSLPLAAGDGVVVGMELRTGPEGRAAFHMDEGHTVRLDRATTLQVERAGTLRLVAGGLYVESRKDVGTPGGLEILTARGAVRDVGTRFEVRTNGEDLTVRVRDGSVRFFGPDASADVGAGNEMRVDPGSRVSSRPLAPNAPEWDWITEIAPMMRIEGRTLRDFLDWFAAERGLSLLFADDAARQAADRTVLKGNVSGLTLDQALQAVLPASGMSHRISDDHLVIEREAAAASHPRNDAR